MTQDVFEAAVDAVVEGDEAALKALLAADTDLVHARSSRHGATLLHYISANGVEDERQKVPANAVAIARLLLDAGADPNATADFYGGPMTTLLLLVSSVPPHKAGLQAALAVLLLDAGADGQDALLTTLASGYDDTARALLQRLTIDSLPEAAGFGLYKEVDARMPTASVEDAHKAVVLAAMYGRIHILERLVASGVDLNRFNPTGFHGHSTPLHQAVAKGDEATVRWLVEHGARTDIADTRHGGTALDWAHHEGHAGIAAWLETR